MPPKQSPQEPRSSHHLVIVTDGEAALLAAHRSAAGTVPPADVSLKEYDQFITQLMDYYRDALVEHAVTEVPVRAKMILLDRMIKVQESA